MILLNLLLEINSATGDTLSKSHSFPDVYQLDQWGLGITIVGMAIVFATLFLLYIIFQTIQIIINYKPRKIINKNGIIDNSPVVEPSGEVNAAIALAIFMNREENTGGEDTVLTIKKVAKTYSPWSSKIYGLNIPPLKIFQRKGM
jgi:Na+-transporting methylmalonyl-CoA/oxaloacetate decarboxylase gamma subunit